jgi:hypothetical protein
MPPSSSGEGAEFSFTASASSTVVVGGFSLVPASTTEGDALSPSLSSAVAAGEDSTLASSMGAAGETVVESNEAVGVGVVWLTLEHAASSSITANAIERLCIAMVILVRTPG